MKYRVHYHIGEDGYRIPPVGPQWLLVEADSHSGAALAGVTRDHVRSGALVAVVTAYRGPRHPSGVPICVHRIELTARKMAAGEASHA